MKTSFTIRLQYSDLISGSTLGQRIGSSETTSSSCSSLDHAMYFPQLSLDLSNFSVAINQGVIVSFNWGWSYEIARRKKHSTARCQVLISPLIGRWPGEQSQLPIMPFLGS